MSMMIFFPILSVLVLFSSSLRPTESLIGTSRVCILRNNPNPWLLAAVPERGRGRLLRRGRPVVDEIVENSEEYDRDSGKNNWSHLKEALNSKPSAKDKFGKVGSQKSFHDDGGQDLLECKHFEVCSGCVARANFDKIDLAIRAQRFFQTQNVELQLHMGNFTEWRTHAKLAVQPLSKWGGLKFGLFRSGTHVVEPIPQCRIHHPRINVAAEKLRQVATDVGVRGYMEPEIGKNGKSAKASGDLRYVQLSVDRKTQKVQLVLVWNADSYKEAGASLQRLVKRLKMQPDLWHSVTVNFHTSNTNAIFNYKPRSWQTVWGPQLLKETVGMANFYFTPQIFRQVC